MKSFTVLCLLCITATLALKLPNLEESSELPDPEKAPELPEVGEKPSLLPWNDRCRLTKRQVRSIRGCTPLEPVYQTTCSGKCYSRAYTNPSIPYYIGQSCTCCKPTSTRRETVKMSCPGPGPVISRPRKLTVTCDNRLKVYFDGVQQPAPSSQLNNWKLVSTFTVPARTRVVGLECQDLHVVGGIIAEGLPTDRSWDCSPRYSRGWNLPSFTGTWPSAYEIGNNGMSPWGVISGLGRGAKWIWTRGWQGRDKNVYCRKELTPEVVIREHTYTLINGCRCRTCPNRVRPFAVDAREAEEQEEAPEFDNLEV